MILDAYIDESYVANGNYYIGVLLVDKAASTFIKSGLDSLAAYVSARHSVPEDCEFHGHSLFQMQDDWLAYRGRPNTAVSVYSSALKVIASSGGSLFFHGIDTEMQRKTYSNPFNPHIVALQYVLERVHDFAVTNDARVNVIADHVPDHHHHEQRIKLFQQIGTMGYRKSRLERINIPFMWSDSKHHRNLQAVDLAVFIHRRRFAHTETSELGDKTVKKLHETIRPVIKHQDLWIPQPSQYY